MAGKYMPVKAARNLVQICEICGAAEVNPSVVIDEEIELRLVGQRT